jgi:hypothetical protein
MTRQVALPVSESQHVLTVSMTIDNTSKIVNKNIDKTAFFPYKLST